jgi:hypothetical protein
VRTNGNKGAITRLYRLNSDGTADTSFGNAATVDLQLGVASTATPIEKDSSSASRCSPAGGS